MEQETRTALYRLYDGFGMLLYVGISTDPRVRWKQHVGDKSWASAVAMRVIEWHDSRQAAIGAEAEVIKNEHPQHNKVHRSQELKPTYRPADDERAALFARYKRAKTLIADLDDPVKTAAVEEMHAGASTKQLADATGLSEETLRQLARAAGVERKRPPTVGREARR